MPINNTKNLSPRKIAALEKAHAATKAKNKKWWWLRGCISNHDSDDCLLWPFGNNKGYGRCWFVDHYVFVHRLAFYLTFGHWPTPQGRHACDTPACFNPRHILEGTQAQNSADMVSRNRSSKGERHGLSKLTDEDVKDIRSRYKLGNGNALAKEYGVSNPTIYYIIHRQTWTHV